MNMMMEALNKSRNDSSPVTSEEAMPGVMGKNKDSGNHGEMQKYWMMMQDMNGKMDQILKLLSGNKPADEAKENEPNGNGNGY